MIENTVSYKGTSLQWFLIESAPVEVDEGLEAREEH
jgi:hypothetical protein